MSKNNPNNEVKESKPKSGAIPYEAVPSWINDIAPERFNNDELFKIVIFFVFHSPCIALTSLGRDLTFYGWNNPWLKPIYLNRRLLAATSTADTFIYATKSLEDMVKPCTDANLFEHFPCDLDKERVAIYDSQSNQFMSIFYHIRNSFAHGRLNMYDIGIEGDYVFVMEDIAARGKKKGDPRPVSARMIIRKSTLIKWIDIIESGPEQSHIVGD